ncbi:MAG: FAD:protein FMN transferase [Phycisphaerae bacterium]|nr:FAD:protein FMN transferase [Phycisphaerae bacterium]
MKTSVNKALIAIGVLALAFLAYVVQLKNQNNNQEYMFQSPTVSRLGTFVTINIRAKNEAQAKVGYFSALKAIDRVNELMSTYPDKPDSDLNRANRLAKEHKVAISDQTYTVIVKAKEFADITDGALDITVVPLIELWLRASQEDGPPKEELIAEAKGKMGLENIILNDKPEKTIAYNGDLKLNVDSLAKGYAVDQALQAIKNCDGIMAALVDIGGEIACFGDYKDDGWFVGVCNPFDDEPNDPFRNNMRWKISVKDKAVATSGDYRQFMMIQGIKYSHIIDPRSGWPVKNVPSVTVIANDCMTADALATAISVLGGEKGLALVNTLEEVECFIVVGDKEKSEIFKSDGFGRYLVD